MTILILGYGSIVTDYGLLYLRLRVTLDTSLKPLQCISFQARAPSIKALIHAHFTLSLTQF